MKPVIFWGATGQAKVLREALVGTDAELIALFDNRVIPSPLSGIPVFYGIAGLDEWERSYSGPNPVHACVAIGGMRGEDRLELLRKLDHRGYPALRVLHRTAFIAEDATLGLGAQILALTAICTGAKLGDGVIVNTKASIDHDCVIGNGVHVAPGATLAGEVFIDDFAFIGTGATVLPRVHIGVGGIVGAGAVVTKDVAAGETVVGNPARPYHRSAR